MIQSLNPKNFSDYELIDSGNYKKLERFGTIITSRPEPQAIWDSSLPETEWNRLAHATFKKEKQHDLNGERGEWVLKKGIEQNWNLNYHHNGLNITFRLGFSSFKHVGIFPEQGANWDFIYEHVKKIKTPEKKVLNLFAYTGGASLAAKAAGADIIHVDSIKQVVSWARANMELSKLNDIRWVIEDALKFVKREAKRGKFYQGIMLDPPSYGHGAAGEKWVIEEHLSEMLKTCKEILDPKEHFFILNLYSTGFSPLVIETLINNIFESPKNLSIGSLYLEDSFSKKLPMGNFGRFTNLVK
ncbi:MAG: oxidoreductase [Cytophagales bacterium]|nr:MAG: oxidoreductase [Cytophagales bacterium]